MRAIHQLVPMLHRGDAVGRHTLALRELLRGRGVASEIYVELVDPLTADLAGPIAGFPDDVDVDETLLVYQFATASGLADWLHASPLPFVVNYHNVTPPQYFGPWDNAIAEHQGLALAQLRHLAGKARLGIAVSEWNRRDLLAVGYGATEVVAPVTGLPSSPTDDRPARAQHAGGPQWLTVGRLAPNKAIEDVIAALFAARHLGQPSATLDIVGSPAVPSYVDALVSQVRRLGLDDAVRFLGKVDDDTLEAAYARADVLVVASEHEGYCLPAVEALLRHLPVVAFDEGALPEVLGDAALLVNDKSPRAFSDAIAGILGDPVRRDQLARAASARLDVLDLPSAGPRTVDLLLDVLDGLRPRSPS